MTQSFKKAKISLLLPTRERPRLAQRFFESVVNETEGLDDIEVILYIDDDDTESHSLDHADLTIVKEIGPRLSMGEYNSRLFDLSSGEIVILVNDDMVIRTKGWDELVRKVHAEYSDGIYLAYGNDLFKGGGLCTFPILSRTTCQVLGNPYPVQYRGAFIDYHIFDIFKRLQKAGHDRIRYLDNVVFEHLHYRTGKAEKDQVYTKRGRFDDDPIFLSLIEERKVGVARLLAAVEGRDPGPKSTLPYREEKPTGLPDAIRRYTSDLLFDKQLPFKWGFRLWAWFLARYVASRGWLRPFVK